MVQDELYHLVCIFQHFFWARHPTHSRQVEVSGMGRAATKEDVGIPGLDDPACRLVSICVIHDHLHKTFNYSW